MKKLTNDHRTRVTRMLIRKAFTTLLCQKPIQSISVKELCELAGINRGTFYAHYSDVYDLRSQIEAEMQEHLEQALLPILKDVGGEVTPVRVTTEIFQCLKDNADLCIVTLGDHGDKDFMAKLLSIGRNFCLESYSKYFEGASPQKIEYFYAFVSSGFLGLLRKWLADGMTVPPEELAAMTEGLMLEGVGILREGRLTRPKAAEKNGKDTPARK